MVAVRDENNIKISVMVLPLLNTSLESDEITMITIINGFPYMNQISIYLSQECKFTNLNDQLLIQPLPIYVSEREYYLHPDQFDFQSKIIFTYEVGDLEAYIINNTLQITNVALIDQLFDDDLVILTFIDFFIYKRKYETLNLAFNDKVINLGALETLGEPVDFSIMWERMEERLDAHEAMAENEEEMNDQMEEIMAY
uniref:Uncharacterized protein n=1 Tax=Romanomermis culicivorax TaxID=13658 RepID=A0A915IGE7_ROMCU